MAKIRNNPGTLPENQWVTYVVHTPANSQPPYRDWHQIWYSPLLLVPYHTWAWSTDTEEKARGMAHLLRALPQLTYDCCLFCHTSWARPHCPRFNLYRGEEYPYGVLVQLSESGTWGEQ